MKHYLLLILIVPFLMACKKDKEPEEPMDTLSQAPSVGVGKVALHHDDDNMDAPVLEMGSYRVAAKYNSTDIAEVSGGKLVAVQYYMAHKPSGAILKIFKGGVSAPDTEVYEANILSGMNAHQWNVHQMTDSVVIDEPIWIEITFDAQAETKFIGCDPGPANANGDWMWFSGDDEWKRYVNRTETSINWNIRGVVVP